MHQSERDDGAKGILRDLRLFVGFVTSPSACDTENSPMFTSGSNQRNSNDADGSQVANFESRTSSARRFAARSSSV
jgi:hypothetical protein